MLYCIVWTGIRVVLEFYQIKYSIVVGDIVKTTFELNFDFYQAYKQHGCTKIWKHYIILILSLIQEGWMWS